MTLKDENITQLSNVHVNCQYPILSLIDGDMMQINEENHFHKSALVNILASSPFHLQYPT